MTLSNPMQRVEAELCLDCGRSAPLAATPRPEGVRRAQPIREPVVATA